MRLMFREGDYVTNQRRLYRVLQIVPTRRILQIIPTRRRIRAAILEDCRTLDVILFRPTELDRMQLQVVRPGLI
jgi:hypothetical protein